MEREELISTYNATSTDDGHGELETYEAWLERQLLSRIEKLDKLEHPLPPAEGAEAIVKKYEDEYDFKFHWVQRDRVIRMMREFAAQQQPTAEDAEEIAQRCPVCGGNGLVPNGFYLQTSGSWSTASIAPETCRSCNGTGVVFATLHAQRIAEKMVEDMYLNMQYYMEYCQQERYVTPQEWIEKHKHF